MSDVTASDEKLIPYVGSQFNVKIDGMTAAQFTEVSGLTIDIQDIESVVNEGGGEFTRYGPGTIKYNEITLKRELTTDKQFYEWTKNIFEGKVERKTGTITSHDFSGAAVGEWSLSELWPSKWSASDLDVGSDDVMVEEVTLQVELVKRVK